MPSNTEHDRSRRAFMKTAVAIGGASALSACLDRREAIDLPRGPDDLSSLPNRQHAWNDALRTDQYGNPRKPRHNVVLLLNYQSAGPPAEQDRRTVELVLETLEQAYKRSHDGLLFTLGYTPAYFDRFEDASPDVELSAPKALTPFEDPTLDHPDAALHLASDHASVVLAAEQALLGKQDSLNGIIVNATFDGIFETVARRTGFAGSGLPADHQSVAGIPDSKPVSDDAPLYMGFKSGFEKSQASEDRVTIQSGPFAEGTTEHISTIGLHHLDKWYKQDNHFQRVGKMFCPAHASADRVKSTGENLGQTSRMGKCASTEQAAQESAVVGHSQKMVSVRENGRAIILRRDFDSTNGGRAGLHFVALQRDIDDFVKTRNAMNGTDIAEKSAVGQTNNNGILEYMSVTHRGNFLLPPRKLRAFPPARPT